MSRPKPDLDALRAQIAALEKRPVLAGDVVSKLAHADHADETGIEVLSTPAGVLHEVFADETRHSGTALGFALGLAKGLIGADRHALIYLQLHNEAQEFGLPYGVGVNSYGLDPEQIVIGRIGTLPDLLWALEEAIACRAVAGVIVDINGNPKILDFTVSRRLSMRAAAAGTSAFIVRYGQNREASAAKLRWRVSPFLSAEAEFDASSPGPPRFTVDIEKCRLGSRTQGTEGKSMILEWTENGFVSVNAPSRNPSPAPAFAPSSRPVLAALGNRLSEAS